MKQCLKMKVFRRMVLLVILAVNGMMSVDAAVAPDAGQTASSVQTRQQAPPEEIAPSIQVREGQQAPPKEAAGPKIKVNSMRITGQSIFPEEQLIALVADSFGRELTLPEIEGLAGRITAHFHKRGYLVAQTIIPAQEVKDGIVNLQVIVGQYGAFDVRNHARLSNSSVNGLLSSLKSGDYIVQAKLERVLLLLNDLGGISAKATLAPGKTFGTSDLVLEVNDADAISGSFSADNYGNRFTGERRAGATINIKNPGRIGDQLDLEGIYTGSGMDNVEVDYQVPVGNHGARLGAEYERTNYLLGEEFASLGASGEAKTTSVYASYPFVRTRRDSLYGRIGYDNRKLADRQDATDTSVDKQAGIWNLSLNGYTWDRHRDGVTSYAISYSTGRLDIDTPEALFVDELTARTAGRYNKANLNLARLKQLNHRLSYFISFNGQLASKNLDSSEKLFLGGANGVRAYPEGEAGGDTGYLFNSELRWNLPKPNFQLVAFVDNGRVKLNKNLWDASDNTRSLTGAGLGLIWSRANDYGIRCDYAWKVTSDPATSDTDKNGRLWLRGTKYF